MGSKKRKHEEIEKEEEKEKTSEKPEGEPKKKKKKKEKLNEKEEGKESEKPEGESEKKKEKNDKKNKKSAGFDVDEGKTIFVRNIQFDSRRKDVEEGFKKYGEVDRAFLVLDKTKSDGSHKGTAFVKFKTAAGAEAALEEEKKIKEKLRQLGLKDPLTPIEGYGVMIKGRRAIVLPPTKPEQAPARKEARKAERLAQKEKWSHLLRMGTITEEKNKWEWNKLNKGEQNLRISSAKQRKFQINDPNFVVNPLRLSIRNLPVFVDSSAVQKSLKAQKINHRKVVVIRSKDRKD